jgi:cytochrome P450
MVDARLEKVKRGDTSRDGTLLDAIADIGEDGQPIMSRKQAFDELKTFLFAGESECSPPGQSSLLTTVRLGAGHDTTGNALTWCFFHLATDPEALRKLRHEADHVLPRATSYSDLERAPYLNNFIKEILRLHPSAGFTRLVTAEEGVTLGGINVPKNSEIFFIPTLIMQQERYYERALEFIPERWEEGSSLKMDNRAYYPFSLGPRNCIGMKLAQLELRCILVEVVRRWDIVYDGEKGAPGTYLCEFLACCLRWRPR